MSLYRSRRSDAVAGLIIALLVAAAVAFVVLLFRADDTSDQNAAAIRAETLRTLVARYDVETIEVTYEVRDASQFIDLDQRGDLDDAVLRVQVEPVVSIDGVRRADCRIADEMTDHVRLDCANGEPTERTTERKTS